MPKKVSIYRFIRRPPRDVSWPEMELLERRLSCFIKLFAGSVILPLLVLYGSLTVFYFAIDWRYPRDSMGFPELFILALTSGLPSCWTVTSVFLALNGPTFPKAQSHRELSKPLLSEWIGVSICFGLLALPFLLLYYFMIHSSLMIALLGLTMVVMCAGVGLLLEFRLRQTEPRTIWALASVIWASGALVVLTIGLFLDYMMI